MFRLCVQLICRLSASRSSRSAISQTGSVHQSDQSSTSSARAPVCQYASCRGTPNSSRSGHIPRRYSIAAWTTSYDIAKWRLPATTVRRGRIVFASCAVVNVSATCARRTSRQVDAPVVGDVRIHDAVVVVDVVSSRTKRRPSPDLHTDCKDDRSSHCVHIASPTPATSATDHATHTVSSCSDEYKVQTSALLLCQWVTLINACPTQGIAYWCRPQRWLWLMVPWLPTVEQGNRKKLQLSLVIWVALSDVKLS